MRTVAVSGYFNPLHKGHIELFHLAKKLGDRLVVIVNNDKQVALKNKEEGSKPFQDENERMLIISELQIVDEVFLSIDTDRLVARSLMKVKPDIFANGGDVKEIHEKEHLACEVNKVSMVFNLGGKIQSSSKLKKTRKYKRVKCPKCNFAWIDRSG